MMAVVAHDFHVSRLDDQLRQPTRAHGDDASDLRGRPRDRHRRRAPPPECDAGGHQRRERRVTQSAFAGTTPDGPTASSKRTCAGGSASPAAVKPWRACATSAWSPPTIRTRCTSTSAPRCPRRGATLEVDSTVLHRPVRGPAEHHRRGARRRGGRGLPTPHRAAHRLYLLAMKWLGESLVLLVRGYTRIESAARGQPPLPAYGYALRSGDPEWGPFKGVWAGPAAYRPVSLLGAGKVTTRCPSAPTETGPSRR